MDCYHKSRWQSIKDIFRMRPGVGDPVTFLCGSEQNLRTITQCLLQIHPSLFQAQEYVTICYRSSTRHTKGDGTLHRIKDYFQVTSTKEILSVVKTCHLIFNYNEFSGTEWAYSQPEDALLIPQMAANPNHIGLSNLVGLYEKPVDLLITTHLPSDNETANAFVFLSEWLNGKVTEHDKQVLLNMSLTD